jgi:hypothetical protein
MAVKQIKIGSNTFNLDAYNSDTVDGYHISVVASLPSNKQNNTIYIVTG